MNGGFFVTKRIERWSGRNKDTGLSESLFADAPKFLSATSKSLTPVKPVFLHGDLAPENSLVSKINGEWEFTGIFDFGNALRGDLLFELTATGLLTAQGDVEIFRSLLEGYAADITLRPDLQDVLTLYTLIHPMADLPSCLDLVPNSASCSTWKEVSALFWPQPSK